MTLKNTMKQTFLRAGRVVPLRLWGILTDLDARLSKEEDKFKLVAVSVSTGNGNGSSAADSTLVGGTPVSCISAGNQDQLVDNVEVLADGKVKVTLAANATAQNTFNVLVQKA